MNTYTEHIYSFANASLTLRAIEHLRNHCQSQLKSVTVINLIDRWLIKINLKDSASINYVKNLQAFLNELGVSYEPSPNISIALNELETGESPINVMNRYKVVIVAYGQPEKEEIEIFREQIVDKLGYCPQNMA